jgi:hypothetical protein
MITEKQYAVLKGKQILDNILKDKRKWTCRHCGHKTTILSELCDRCRIEDLTQGNYVEDTKNS